MKVSEVVEIEVVEEEVENEGEFEKRRETIWELIDTDFILRKTKHQLLQDSDKQSTSMLCDASLFTFDNDCSTLCQNSTPFWSKEEKRKSADRRILGTNRKIQINLPFTDMFD